MALKRLNALDMESKNISEHIKNKHIENITDMI